MLSASHKPAFDTRNTTEGQRRRLGKPPRVCECVCGRERNYCVEKRGVYVNLYYGGDDAGMCGVIIHVSSFYLYLYRSWFC